MCETRWPPHRPEGTLVHSRIPSPVDQQKIKRIRECMCNHRHRKVSSARQIQPTEYDSVQNILHHTSAALVDVRATKRNTDHDQAYSPSHFRTTKQASRTIGSALFERKAVLAAGVRRSALVARQLRIGKRHRIGLRLPLYGFLRV